MEEEKKVMEEELPEELRPVEEKKEEAPIKKYNDSDDDLIEEPTSEDGAPIAIIYRCKKCGQILEAGSKDCWNCSSKEIEEIVEEDTKEVQKVLLQARMDKIEHEMKSLKKNNDFLYVLFAVMVVLFVVFMIMQNR